MRSRLAHVGLLALTPAVLLLATSSCHQPDTTTPIDATPARVVLQPDSTNVAVGGQKQFSAVAQTSTGRTVAAQLTYSATGGTISADGLFTAGSTAGVFQVIAALVTGALADTSVVVVQSTVPPARVTVTPATDTLHGAGATVQLTAHAFDAAGTELTGRTFTWSSSNNGVARVDGSGLVTAAGSGTATITATDSGVQGSATVVVTAPSAVVTRVTVTPATDTLAGVGATVQLTAHAFDASGTELTGESFAWASSNASVATVNGSGLVTAVAAGAATITATDAGVQGSASITVTVPSSSHSYSTGFPLTENPISEGGQWLNGGTIGLDWSNVQTLSSMAVGLQGGTGFTDATALLTGTWGPDQTAAATVYAVNQKDACSQKVELRLRSSLSAHVNTGYAISFKVSRSAQQGSLTIARWNGALGDVTSLLNQAGAQFGIKNGDAVSATMQGNVISVFKNGVLVGQATDNTFTGGSPGMGFSLDNSVAGCPGTNGDYGFTEFSAHD